MMPDSLIESPATSSGLISHEVIVEPDVLGDIEIGWPSERVKKDWP